MRAGVGAGLGSLLLAGVYPLLGIAQTVGDPSTVIETPDDARAHGLESLRVALKSDGGVPLPPNLSQFVTDRKAAIQLGKALFWDMQVGSDAVQACASCHFHAGGDNRARNQMNPDLLRVAHRRDSSSAAAIKGFGDAPARPDTRFESVGPDGTLTRADFPFVRTIQSVTRNSDGSLGPANGNSNDIGSSMGVFFTRFLGTRGGVPQDLGERLTDPVFSKAGKTLRRVEPRNTPTVINAVLNFTNFWDGRANHFFNGATPFGQQDPTATVLELQRNGELRPRRIALANSSLASQAVGPPLSHFEMSFGDPDNGNARTFPELGKKLLRGRPPLRPLGLQHVDPKDSVLGSLSAYPDKGITQSYRALIQAAFNKKYWGFEGLVEIKDPSISPDRTAGQIAVQTPGTPQDATSGPALDSPQTLNPDPTAAKSQTSTGIAPTPTRAAELDGMREQPTDRELTNRRGPRPGFSQMEANFSLFFGIAVMLYEATLVSDQTPFDVWMETGRLSSEFDSDALAGLNLFVGKGSCINCHGGPEMTNASVRHANRGRNVIEPMLMARGTAVYDTGFYNIGVVPTSDDLGRGGKDLNGKPLAFSRQALFERVLGIRLGFPITGNDGIPAVDEDGNVVCQDANGNGRCDPREPLAEGFQRVAVDGAFKAPGIRNQELMGPYMHNGGLATLRQVVEFYNRGGNFCRINIDDLDPDIQPIGMSDRELDQLVHFIVSLTDERVRFKRAPFDHPELFVPDQGLDERGMLRLPEVGGDGVGKADALRPFLELDPEDSIFTPAGECSKD